MHKSHARYGALEDDADNAAVGAVVSLWGGAKGKLGEISRNAMPRLKSGLRLQRCKDCLGDREEPKVEEKNLRPKTQASPVVPPSRVSLFHWPIRPPQGQHPLYPLLWVKPEASSV